MAMLFCNIGWMDKYDGLMHGKKIKRGGKFVETHERGFEICNFSKVENGKTYGYVQAMYNTIKIEKLGANKNDEFIDGVTVIWTANNEDLRTTFIVGWYENARVYRNFQEFDGESEQHLINGVTGYNIVAQEKNVHLINLDARTFKVPRGKPETMGQSNVWYADQPRGIEFIQKVSKYISQNKQNSKSTNNFNQNNPADQITKVEVEKRAIRFVISYYQNLGYEVESVESDNLGYDLVSWKDNIKLLVEVKGLSGLAIQIGLTPNEYKFFKTNDTNYRLIIINNTLEEPSMTICRFSPELGNWLLEGNENHRISIEPKEAAIVKIS